MTNPLMPKATAVWLIENTALTFEQIAEFCGMHLLEIQGIADGEMGAGIVGLDPTSNGQLTLEEIHRCEADPKAPLQLQAPADSLARGKKKSPYVPLFKRQDRPNAIAWLLKHHPHLKDHQIMRLVGTTKKTIEAIRHKTHSKMTQIKAQDPVHLGICSQADLDREIKESSDRSS